MRPPDIKTLNGRPPINYVTLGTSTGVYAMMGALGGSANALLMHILLSKRSSTKKTNGSLTIWNHLSPLKIQLLGICVLELLVAVVLAPATAMAIVFVLQWGVRNDMDIVDGREVQTQYVSVDGLMSTVCHLPLGANLLFNMVRTLLLEAVSVERYLLVSGHQRLKTKSVWAVLLLAYVLGAVLMVTQASQQDTLLTIRLCHHSTSDVLDQEDRERVAVVSSYFRMAVVMQALLVSVVMAVLTSQELHWRGEAPRPLDFCTCWGAHPCSCLARHVRGSYDMAALPVDIMPGRETVYGLDEEENQYCRVLLNLSQSNTQAEPDQTDEDWEEEAKTAGPVLLYSVCTLFMSATSHILLTQLQIHYPGSSWIEVAALSRVVPCVVYPVYVMMTVSSLREDVEQFLQRLVSPGGENGEVFLQDEWN